MDKASIPRLDRADRGIITAFLVIGLFGGGCIAGLGITALAYVFRAGNRLEQDTEGLV